MSGASDQTQAPIVTGWGKGKVGDVGEGGNSQLIERAIAEVRRGPAPPARSGSRARAHARARPGRTAISGRAAQLRQPVPAPAPARDLDDT